VGVPTRGEGLFALQRAFHLAGARTVVASLWKVDDDATAAFMEEFYRNVFERRLDKAEGFRRAQVAMLWRYDPAARRLRPEPARADAAVPVPLPAAYWAAFVLSGDWR
jgi:CHAT domain-containing protein